MKIKGIQGLKFKDVKRDVEGDGEKFKSSL